VQFGGDLIIASADGIFPISFVTRGGSSLLQASSKEYSSKIRARIGPALRETFTTRGWEMVVHPGERLMLVSVPYLDKYKDVQFAMNTTVNEWCQFQGIPTFTYGSTGGYLFAGTTDGRVLLILNGNFDAVAYGATTGFPVYGVVQPSFSDFKSPALQKIFHMVRPQFLAQLEPGYSVFMATNYQKNPSAEYPNIASGVLAQWDAGRWDQSRWAVDGGVFFGNWVGTPGIGLSGSASVQTAAIGDTLLTAIDYMFEIGGPM
jgi:hypothetical protein